MRKYVIGFLGLATLAAASPALAAESLGGGGCITDLSLSAGSSLTNCYGRFSGNVLNNTGNTEINTALTALGYAGPAITYSAIESGSPASILSPLMGNQVLNYPGAFNGTVYLGVHYGGGQGGPGNSTTFYRISATNLDVINLTLRASSTATIFSGLPATTPVPEPATWAMMIGGFGIVGGVLRRRQQRIAATA